MKNEECHIVKEPQAYACGSFLFSMLLAFSAFGVGFALGKAIETEITSFTDFIKTTPNE